ncbi:hypothetical protein AVEN_52629-1 [Araneus ventricosus]|uniref:Uncharacterized protein n=1 Tax=Araneus ventricosus TaxID=182803 RepID=A0A4Y2ERQ1_ARAVE|nr:hypothetical protein AVEN_52629-1 [Araneus ventricosus]
MPSSLQHGCSSKMFLSESVEQSSMRVNMKNISVETWRIKWLPKGVNPQDTNSLPILEHFVNVEMAAQILESVCRVSFNGNWIGLLKGFTGSCPSLGFP